MTAEMALELMPSEYSGWAAGAGHPGGLGSATHREVQWSGPCLSGAAPASVEHVGWHQGSRREGPIMPLIVAGKSTTTQGAALQVSTKVDRVTAGPGVTENIERQLLSTDFPPTLLS